MRLVGYQDRSPRRAPATVRARIPSTALRFIAEGVIDAAFCEAALEAFLRRAGPAAARGVIPDRRPDSVTWGITP